MSSVIIGIDPGLTGAIVVLGKGWAVLDAFAMPVFKHRAGNRVDGAALASRLSCWDDAHAVLEEVHAMPKDGAIAAHTFGRSVGVVQGVVQALNMPLTEVSPVAWKKAARTSVTKKAIEGVRVDATEAEVVAYKARLAKAARDAKDVSRGRAIELWPQWEELRRTKKAGQAYADAALLARFSGVVHD